MKYRIRVERDKPMPTIEYTVERGPGQLHSLRRAAERVYLDWTRIEVDVVDAL